MYLLYYLLAGIFLLVGLGSLGSSFIITLIYGLFVGLFIFLGNKSSQKSKKRTLSNENKCSFEIEMMASRLVDVINESLKIANESKNPDTKISRLNVAKDKLEDLKKLEKENSFLHLEKLDQVEYSITELEQEFEIAGYQEIAENNLRGNLLEKEGEIDEAITIYEGLLSENVDTPFTYRRLAILYRKKKLKEDELRVVKAALNNVPSSNHTHYQWFADRLAKMV